MVFLRVTAKILCDSRADPLPLHLILDKTSTRPLKEIDCHLVSRSSLRGRSVLRFSTLLQIPVRHVETLVTHLNVIQRVSIIVRKAGGEGGGRTSSCFSCYPERPRSFARFISRNSMSDEDNFAFRHQEVKGTARVPVRG